MVRAAESLEALPVGADEAAYADLQIRLDAVAPAFSDSGWGHKYLSVLYPEKIDTFHSAAYQQFHLVKLLIRPVSGAGHARYVAAGQFREIAAHVHGGIPLLHLTQALTARHGRRPHAYWAVATRAREGAPSQWDFMLREACVSVPDGAAQGDTTLRPFPKHDSLREGDVVAATDGGHVLGLGYVRGERYQVADDPHPQRVPVEWRSLDYWTLPVPESRPERALRRLGTRVDNLIEIERHLIADAPPFQASPPGDSATIVAIAEDKARPFYTAPRASERDATTSDSATPEETPGLCGIPARIEETLRRKGQVILYGPPGTGKSYWAEIAARELAARSWFGRTWSRLTPAQQTRIAGDTDAAVRTCCFHPAYGYEDFLEGYRPDQRPGAAGDLRFERRDGIFKRLCADADNRPDRDFFLIVDEINRGDVPRIFGELLAVMETSKRGKNVLLPLSGEIFHVPANVYLIGTMNTADRSIALLDAALRRRFGFIALGPDLSLFVGVRIGDLPLDRWLGALNDRIAARLERGEGRHLRIGHAYLLEASGEPVRDLVAFTRILRDDLVPLLEEYTADDPALLEALLGSGLYDARRGMVRAELFTPTRSGDLLHALGQTLEVSVESSPSFDDEEL